MANGKPPRFANADQDRDAVGWSSVEKFEIEKSSGRLAKRNAFSLDLTREAE
jgi:hypothetical protein